MSKNLSCNLILKVVIVHLIIFQPFCSIFELIVKIELWYFIQKGTQDPLNKGLVIFHQLSILAEKTLNTYLILE